MRIAINTTSAVAGGGITYLKNLLRCLSKTPAGHQYLIITTPFGKETFHFQHPDFTFLSFSIPSKGPLLRILWEQCILPSILKKERVDVLFSPGNICPLFSAIPNVVLIQNAEPLSNNPSLKKSLFQNIRLRLLKKLTLFSVKKARRVIFPSDMVRILVEKMGISVEHAVVIYHGINKEIFHLHYEDDVLHLCKKKYGLERFILYVSHIQRYKNFTELIKAFILLKDRIDDTIKLVFAGECFDSNYYDEMQAFIAEHKYGDRIIFLGNVSYTALPYLYSACLLFVYPSICESFGMTLTEAMSCGAPILASHVEPIREICADAAVYFDPTDPAAIAKAVFNTLTDNNLISTLKIKSLKRSEEFSWENTVKKTLSAFEGVI
ncbi:MAG: glycosyltransferase family 4 protein [Candidatus Loosdrechtia sp.]|uniref:glycosyltransferase family 4 protein n=1 Tax=Candidatus Loosdrechtia sp. TaxID=3101272 RepID=UPI003A6844DB|nr:MAG: glycosyltransferase family 1 protein [Candidatus Jettenia sp. AMX2]